MAACSRLNSAHDPVHQITIVPRGGAGGMTISLPTEDRSYQSKRYMEEQIVSLLGGRVAEKLMLGDISTGASNDIQRASQIARKMVTVYGMSDRLGSISFESGHDEIFIGRSMAQAKPYSEQVAAQIDEEVKSIVDAAYERCEDILIARSEAPHRRGGIPACARDDERRGIRGRLHRRSTPSHDKI